MNFIEAVKLCKDGKKIKRERWAKSLYLFFNEEKQSLFKHHTYIPKYGDQTPDITYEPYLPDINDFLADDWEIIREKPKTVTFQEAFYALKDDKIIKRLSNQITFCKHSNFEWISRDPETKTIGTNFYGYNIEIFSYEDILAKDWIIIDE